MNTENFTQTEELLLEVLIARYRLGERIWTFRSIFSVGLESLQRRGIVFVMHGVVEKTVRAGLTDGGIEGFITNSNYTPPSEREEG